MNLTNEQAERLINDDICPACGKDLDTGYECTGCGKDWRETVEALLSGGARKMKIAVLYHADEDGFGAAFAAHTALSEQHELLFKEVQYGEEPPYDELRAFNPNQVYILDFSYKSNVLKDLMAEFSVAVIDHHKTAAEDLKDFPEIEVVSFFEKDGVQFPLFRGVRILQENSGCVLAWLFFCPDQEIPEILHYVQDRDLWRFDLEHSKEINAYIGTMEKTFEAWADFYMPLAYDAGKAVIAFRDKQIEGRVKAAEVFETQYFNLAGDTTVYPIPIVNASENISELGEALCFAFPEAPFSITYCDRPGGKRSYSLWSRNGFDVSEVAKAFGGGGHHAAAGFTLPSPNKI